MWLGLRGGEVGSKYGHKQDTGHLAQVGCEDPWLKVYRQTFITVFELVHLNAEMRVLSAGSIFHPLYFGVCVCLCAYVHVCDSYT